MSRFIERALQKLPKMDGEQVRSLVDLIADENRKLEGLLDSLTVGLLVCDRNHAIVLCNKAAERLLPFAPGELYEKHVWLAIDDPKIAEFLRASLEGEDSVPDREFALSSGGSATRMISLSSSPLVREGRIEGTILRAEDVTEKRSKEARLRRAESLASLTTLAAGVAHEIKNPLGSMSIHMQLIRKAMAGKASVDPASIAHFLDVVNEEIERLNRIVVDFLFAVRPMDIALEDCDLNKLLGDLVDFLHYEAEAEHIAIESELDPDLPLLKLDPRYIKQALLNLVKNALNAMPGGGKLTISTRALEAEAEVTVADTGYGIPEENLPKIFEPYFTTKEFGSGLGLTLVFKIVKEHLGEITVKSREGEGSAFTISLPLPRTDKKLIGYGGSDAAV